MIRPTIERRLSRMRLALIEMYNAQNSLELADETDAAELQALMVMALAAKIHRVTVAKEKMEASR